MTKEEIVQAISDDKMMPFIQPEQLAGIVDFVIKNYHLGLPSDLDEAADAYSENILANGEDMFDAIADGFRAGAEWMAGQGVAVEGVFRAGDPGFPDVRMGEQYSIEHILRKPGGIEPGDKVIVQIRKK